MLLTVLLTCGGLGFILGRRRLVFLVVVSPIAFWWIWAAASTRGPDDDITGPAGAIALLLSLGAVMVGVTGRWLVYGVASLVRRAG